MKRDLGIMKQLPDRQILIVVFMAALLPFLMVEIFPSTLYHVVEIKKYLLFHNIAEIFSVVVAMSIFGVGWFTYDHSKDRHILFLGAAFLAIGLMDFMHTLGYAGMPPFITPNSANKSTQYWIAVRLFSSAAFLGSAFIYPDRPLRWHSKPILIATALALPLAIFTGVTFFPAEMPATFIEGVGLTPFKRISEGIIISLLILASAAYWKRMRKTGDRLLVYYLAAFVLCIFSELVFAVYKSVFDTYNVLGHIYKVVAFYLIYRGAFVTSVSYPFVQLSEVNEKLLIEIDERKKAETELRKSEERYRSLATATSQIVWTTNAEGEVVDDIPMWRSYTGQEETDVKGRGWIEALHPDDRLLAGKTWADSVETCSLYDMEFRIRRFDGEYRYFSVRGVPVLEDGGAIREWVGACTDISERKRAEGEIIKAKEEWERTFDAITDPLMVVDVGHRIRKVNLAMAGKLGKRPSALQGLYCFSAVHGVDVPPPFCPHEQLLADARPHSAEIHVDKLGGDFFVSVSPLLSPDGALFGSVHYARDISERKRAEAERKRLEEQLRQAQKMEAIGQLSGGIAHDFNNILTAIIGFSNIMKMKLDEYDPMQADIDQILAASDRAAHLTRGMLAYSRKQIMTPKPVDLNDIVRKGEKFLRRVIGEEVDLRSSLSPDPLNLCADSVQIEQVLMNLATNARDAMPHGGTLSISTGIFEIDDQFVNSYDFAKPGSYALLTITDTGVGMDENTVRRIYEPFFTTKEVGKGIGLGLSVVYGIVKQHDGFIFCDSVPGRGTTFRIYLPIAGV